MESIGGVRKNVLSKFSKGRGKMKKLLPGIFSLVVLAGCGAKKPATVTPQENATKKEVSKPEVETVKMEKVEKPKVVIKPKAVVSTEDLTVKNFKHSDHEKIIKEYGCIPCHHFNYEMHIPNVEKAKVVSEKLLKPSKVACNVCHKGEK